MRGIDSIAKAITPDSWRRSIPCRSVSGARKPITTTPLCSAATWSGDGRTALTTISASSALSTSCAPAPSYSASRKDAVAPALRSTSSSRPAAVSFATESGTSATRRSPAAVSRGMPTLTARNSKAGMFAVSRLLPHCSGGDGLHRPLRARRRVPDRRRRELGRAGTRRDGAHRRGRARVAGALLDRRRDRGGRGRGNRLRRRRRCRVLRGPGRGGRDRPLRADRRRRRRGRGGGRSSDAAAAVHGAGMRSLGVLIATAALCLGAGGASPPVPAFRHVVVIVFENKEASGLDRIRGGLPVVAALREEARAISVLPTRRAPS